MMGFFKNFWMQQDTLERKLFWSILVVVTLAATTSAVFTIYEGLSWAASLCSAGCSLVCLIVALVAIKTSQFSQCYLVMCCVLNWFLLPLLFLFCGGITSGMPLYCITGNMLYSFSDRRKIKFAAFIISLLIQLTLYVICWLDPSMLPVTLERNESYLDFIVTMVVTSLTLFFVAAFAMREYGQERTQKQELLSKLDYLSNRDPLTEMYNLRYMIGLLENVAWRRRNDFYLLMVNIDNFKRVNDYYGLMVGDQVLNSVAKILKDSEDSLANECVARYGGATFVYVLNAGSEVEAYSKAESIRKAAAQLTWESNPQIHVTISGGLVALSNRSFGDYKQALSKVDELVQTAKNQGKNQICNMVEN